MDWGDWRVFYEISPLFEEHWTGIPKVAAELARALDARVPGGVEFFHGMDRVDGDAVREALRRGTGRFLKAPRTGPVKSRETIGIFPSRKSARRMFDLECSVIHDISTIVTPQFHAAENLAHHAEALRGDIASNDLTICVSEATAAELAAYLSVPQNRMLVAHNGVFWDPATLAQAQAAVALGRVERYFLTLGTREPRKNIGLVLRMLTLYPELLETHRFVFTGRAGWLEEEQTMPPELQGARDQGRISFTGYLSEIEKCSLIMAAEASIYPSFYEGFGLPVIESLSLGTPCIASCSSSIPEAGGGQCFYFDPFSPWDLRRAVQLVLESPHDPEVYRRSVAGFTWSAMASRILDRVARLVQSRKEEVFFF